MSDIIKARQQAAGLLVISGRLDLLAGVDEMTRRIVIKKVEGDSIAGRAGYVTSAVRVGRGDE